MQTLKQQLKKTVSLIIFSTLLGAYQSAIAETDFADQEKLLKARVTKMEQEMDHSAHLKPVEKSQQFHGVFYGFLPCKDCNGIKATLSLKQNNLYLLVTQPAKESSREFFEKGKYTWNDETQTVVLTPKKEGEIIRQYHIENEGTLVQLNSDGSAIKGDKPDSYTLRRSDIYKSREVHIH